MVKPLMLLTSIFLFSACDPAKITPGSSLQERASYEVSGTITYDRVPITDGGLDYEGTIQKPVRKVLVQAIDEQTGRVLSYTTTDSNGEYTIKIPTDVSSAYLRVLSRVPDYSVTVQDNTNDGAFYAFESETSEVTGDATGMDFNIPSGWTGTNAAGSYTDERFAAPFAILDTLLTAYESFLAVRPNLEFPELKVNWSVNNTTDSGNKAEGDIGTSHYSDGQLFILGKDGIDTDEYDTHVMVHEWGHYFENRLGRSDSPGGHHGVEDKIKHPSLAFGEGWGNALSAIVMYPDIYYRDSVGVRSASASSTSLESDSDTIPGWFSENSVQEIIYDIFDSNNEGSDTIALGLGPIIDVMTEYQTQTRAFTSIFSFIKGLKTAYPAQASALNTLTTGKSISNILDDFGTGETNNGGWSFNLPVYNNLVVDGAAVTAKLWGQPFASSNLPVGNIQGNYQNDLFNNRFFKFTATSEVTKINWLCDDSYQIEIHDGNNRILDVGEQMIGTPLTIQNQIIETVPGQTYTIRVYTIGSLVYSTDFFNIQLQLESI